MIRRFVLAFLLLVSLVACGALIQAVPNRAQSPALGSDRLQQIPESVKQGALWVMDSGHHSNYLVAHSPQTGGVLFEMPQTYGVVMSSDGRWGYQADLVVQYGRESLNLAMIDLQRGRIARIVQISQISAYEASDAFPRLALSPDGHVLAVSLTYSTSSEWYTDVSFLDTASGKLITPDTDIPITAVAAEARQAPSVQLIFSQDSKRVFLFQQHARVSADGKSLWSSQIAVLHLDSRKGEHIQVPDEIQADGLSLRAIMARDGKSLYAVEEIVRANSLAGFRFLALDTSTLAIRIQVNQSVENSDQACGFEVSLMQTPDGRYLFTYCPQGYFQFLDVQTGELAPQVRVDRHPGANDFSWELVPAPDGRLVYLVLPGQKQIAVIDLTRREITRSTVIREATPTPPASLFGLYQWLSTPASAKMFPQPGAVLSPDGTRLYFVNVLDLERGDGLWALEAESLQSFGHWLMGKDIYGLHLSGDGRELYAISGSDHTLYVLDAVTGVMLRAFSSGLQQPFGFLSSEQ